VPLITGQSHPYKLSFAKFLGQRCANTLPLGNQ